MEKHHPNGIFQTLLGGLLLFVFVRFAFNVAVPSVVFLAIAAAIALFCDENEIVALLVCCIPLHEMVSVTYTLMVCFSMYMLRNFSGLKLNLSALCLLMAMLLWELLHGIGSPFLLKEFVVDFMPLLALLLLMSIDANRLNYAYIIRCFALVTVCVCLTLIAYLLIAAGFDVHVAFADMQRLGMSTEGSGLGSRAIVNPNSLGVICVLAATGLLQLSIANEGKPGDLAVVASLMTFGMLTLSKTFLLCMLAAMCLLLLSAKNGISEKLKLVIVSAVIVVAVLLLLHLLVPETFHYLIKRLSESDVTTGRVSLISAYHQFLLSRPDISLFGVGLQDLQEKLVVHYGAASHLPHNGLQEAVIVWGLPGLMMFLVLLWLMVRQSRRLNEKQGLINYVPLLVVLIKIQAGQMMTSSYTMLAFALAYVSLCYRFEAEKAKKVVSCSHNVTPSPVGRV